MANGVSTRAAVKGAAGRVPIVYSFSGDPIAAVSSLVVLGDMLLFGWLVYRTKPEKRAPRAPYPAE